MRQNEGKGNSELSCTFCGPGTWSTWEVVTDDGLIFACDRHHAEMSQARIIRLERMKGKDGWDKISEPRLINEEFVDDYE
jgi:hypothetical protein